ncbi:hypothetical protein [Viridibacillus arvi]|uniref:hypothetical protein n=1 Tax=Viridibacillus arvi TaxID=263475 RepID=UPI0034CEE75C
MTKQLYERLHMHVGFIAHYNYNGFKQTYSDFKFLDFVEHFSYPIYPIRIDTDKYRQINEMIRLMKEYVKEHTEQILFEFENKAIHNKVQKLKALANELGYDFAPKESVNKTVDINTTIQSDGQMALF